MVKYYPKKSLYKYLTLLLITLLFSECKKKEIVVINETSDWQMLVNFSDNINDEIKDLAQSDDKTLWAIGTGNFVAQSLDNGLTWKKIIIDNYFTSNGYITSNTTWNSIYFKTPLIGWLAGGYAGQYMYKTIDGGVTWKSVITPATPEIGASGITCIHFITTEVGFVSTGIGKIFKTIDGGTNWKDQNIPIPTLSLNYIEFYKSQFGCVGGRGTLIKTTDSGKTWSILHRADLSKDSIPSPYFTQNIGTNFSVIDETELFAPSTTCLHSVDAGKKWAVISSELNSTWILMRNNMEGFCVIRPDNNLNGFSTMAHTYTGGKNWSKFNLSTNTDIGAVKLKRCANSVFAISSGGRKVFKYNKDWN